tara:strand:+ start:559 stop:1059 length:501 start_codon:yes stop_codon:yes gene_type:complete
MKYFIIIFFFLLISFTSSYSEEKILFVDINYVLNKSNEGIKINKQLNDIQKKNINEFKKIEKKLKIEEDKIISSKNVLSDEELNKKIIDFQKKVTDFKSLQIKKNEELNIKRNTLKKKLLSNLNTIIAEHSKENNISIVLPKSSIVIGKSDLDITKLILKKINQKK